MGHLSKATLPQLVEFLTAAHIPEMDRVEIDSDIVWMYYREFKVRTLQTVSKQICAEFFEGFLTCEIRDDGVDIYRTASLPDARTREYEVTDDSPDSQFADIRLNIFLTDDRCDELLNIIPDGIEGETDDIYVRPSPWKASFLDELKHHPQFTRVFNDWLTKEYLDFAIPVFRGEIVHPAVAASKKGVA